MIRWLAKVGSLFRARLRGVFRRPQANDTHEPTRHYSDVGKVGWRPPRATWQSRWHESSSGLGEPYAELFENLMRESKSHVQRSIDVASRR